MNKKQFYEAHKNFSERGISEYFISPGIKCKFDILKEIIGVKRNFLNGIDLGSSGNSILYFLNNILRKSFFDLANLPLNQYLNHKCWYPICGDLIKLPYRDEIFDFICALDVLEHIKDDQLAVSEISRILKKEGVVIITVPHEMKFYTHQDKLIGHYRRYEINQIISLFSEYNLTNIRTFGVYGRLMKISDIQYYNPKKAEENLSRLRERYISDPVFRKFWKIFNKISSRIMKIDAKYGSLKKMMNIGLIFKKIV